MEIFSSHCENNFGIKPGLKDRTLPVFTGLFGRFFGFIVVFVCLFNITRSVISFGRLKKRRGVGFSVVLTS